MRPIESDAQALDAAPLNDDEAGFWIRRSLSPEAYRNLASRIAERPDAWLTLNFHELNDLEVLGHFTGLRRLVVNSLRLASWDGIRHVAESLEDLAMGDTTLRPISILPIAECTSLRTLRLIGPVRDEQSIARLVGLEELTLRSVTLPNLEPLVPMSRLRTLDVHLGGTTNLSLLPELAPLEELELWRIRGLGDVSILGDVVTLQHLRLQSMSAVATLPSLRRLMQLRRLALDAMKGITDLSPVADAPALEELLLIDMPQLEPEALRPLVRHPTLRRGVWGLGSDRKNAEAWELLPLGDPPFNYKRWKARQARSRAREA